MSGNNKPKGDATRDGVLYIRKLDRRVKQKFKAWCISHDTTMTEKIEQLMRETIKTR